MAKKIVCDTNVFVSGFLWRGNEFRLLSAILEKKAVLFCSPELLSEFIHVLSYEHLRPYVFNPAELAGKLEAMAVFVRPQRSVDVIKEDSSDNWVLECALAAGADLIVSGDRHLLDSGSFEGILILNAKAALEKINPV